ncbi:GNAT family N-acetyltransferase [Marivita sp. S6314]|uniref:GNAT family N-acetyltransferase n=1 Tax=Marivita sp. S6314 TaxID=2926406 RepID=UPI001FF6DC85|nr:GNAT family N-acetyltransferase [Marivita sp. S6314]MCK0151095.1 GNAT family N-acetyltransferase [Marivita sp. S6314]
MIQTPRLTLRLLQSDDAVWVAQEIARPEVHQWLTTPPRPYGLEDARSFVKRNSSDPWYRVIVLDDRPCGIVSVTKGRHGKDVSDLGYWLSPNVWGKGVMTEAATALLQLTFADEEKVESGWIKGNAASQNVLSKLGFQQTGETRLIWSHYHGSDLPVIRVHLDRASWAEVSRAHAIANARASGEESPNK